MVIRKTVLWLLVCVASFFFFRGAICSSSLHKSIQLLSFVLSPIPFLSYRQVYSGLSWIFLWEQVYQLVAYRMWLISSTFFRATTYIQRTNTFYLFSFYCKTNPEKQENSWKENGGTLLLGEMKFSAFHHHYYYSVMYIFEQKQIFAVSLKKLHQTLLLYLCCASIQ